MRRTRDDLSGATTVLYARRSKPDPRNPGKSTADQIDTQRLRAQQFRLDVVAEFTDDGIGASRHSRAKTRPGFVNAVEHLRAHPVEVFSTWELSRATRRLRVYSDLMELCEDRGTYLLIGDRIYDPLDSTDAMILGITAVQDSAEAARIRERTLRGLASHAAAGKPHGRNIYGYERIYDPRTRALLEVREHPEQGLVVREMVRRLLGGEAARVIAADLNARRVPKPTGNQWYGSDLPEMLVRPAYRGLRDHHGKTVRGTWEPLISPEQWSALQRALAGRSRWAADSTAKHLLTGVAMCARCRRPMYVDVKHRSTGREQMSYRCLGCYRSRHAQHLDAHVREVMDLVLADPAARMTMAPDFSGAEQNRTRLTALQAELDDAYTLGLSPRGLKAIEDRLLPQITDLERTLAVTHLGIPDEIRKLPADIGEARVLLRRLARVWVGPAPRGRGFDAGSVRILPVGEELLDDE